MKIVLNGQKLLTQFPAGPEKYTINLYNALSKTDHSNRYIVYFPDIPNQRLWEKISGKHRNFEYRVIKNKISWTHLGVMIQLFKDWPKIYFTPVHTCPLITPPSTKVVAMVHGLEHISNKQFSSKSIRYKIQEFVLRILSLKTRKIIVPSRFTNIALKKFVNKLIPEKNIVIIREAVGDEFKPKTKEECERVLKKFEVFDKKYLIFVSTVQPRKNIINMIAAYSEIIKEHKEFEDITLLICGKPGWNNDEIYKAPDLYNVTDKVRFTGYVEEEDLIYLLPRALGFLNFSFEEGFGLPVLEAMACGVACGISDIDSLRELAMDSAVYANPFDINSIKNAILKIVSENNQEIINKALQLSKAYSWTNTARSTLQVFNDALTKN